MLVYSPALDPHHCIFRILVLLNGIKNKPIETEKLRILDFYFLFPREISSIPLSPLLKIEKKKFLRYPQYEAIKNSTKVFYSLEGVFSNSIKCLIATGLIANDTNMESAIYRTEQPAPEALEQKIQERTIESQELIDFILGQLYPYSLYGPNGLKDRTGLLPSKYDRE